MVGQCCKIFTKHLDLKQFDTISHIVSHIGTKCTNLSADVFDMLSQSIHSLFNKGLTNLFES